MAAPTDMPLADSPSPRAAWGAVLVAGLATAIEIASTGFGTGAGWMSLYLPGLMLAIVVGNARLVFGVVVIACLPALVPIALASAMTSTEWTAFLARALVLGLLARAGLGWRREEARARVAVERDPLTGLLNNPGFRRRIDEERSRLGRGSGPFTLLMIDLDDFKRLNDTHGHVVGDRCLRLVGETLEETTRLHDLVGRLGGDEFAVLLPDTGSEQAATVITRLRAALVVAFERQSWSLGFSLGSATFDSPPDSVDDALAEADRQMYAGKRADALATGGPPDHDDHGIHAPPTARGR